MPYKKTNRKYSKKPRNTAVRRVARTEVKKQLNRQIESKMFDGAINDTSIDYSGSTSAWNLLSDVTGAGAITQGVGAAQYVGTTIRPTYVMIKGLITPADATNLVRVFVIQVITTGTPTVSNLLQSVGNIRAPLSSLDVHYDKTYRVLADRLYSVDTTSVVQKYFKIKIGMRQMRPIHFQGASGAYETGGLYVLAVSDSAIAAHPIMRMYWRIHYKDA